MKLALLVPLVVALTFGPPLIAADPAPSADACDTLRLLIAETYTFRPSELDEAQARAKSQAMDQVWNFVLGDPEHTVGCLRSALVEADADPWFRFNGAMLLVQADPSQESKQLQVLLWGESDLDDVHRRFWMETLARRGAEGFDVSRAGEGWLAHGDAGYALTPLAEPPVGTLRGAGSRPASLEVGPNEGALFLFGCMDERFATPVLKRLVLDPGHPGSAVALPLLSFQATPEAWTALGEIDAKQLPPERRAAFRKLWEGPPQLPGGNPATRFTRAQLLADLHAQLSGEAAGRLPEGTAAGDWIQNAVRELTSEDIPLLRTVRRQRLTRCTNEAVSDYVSCSLVLQQLTWSAAYFPTWEAPVEEL